MNAGRLGGHFLVDCHVHLHDFFAHDAFLDCAIANLRSGCRELGLDRMAAGVLMFSESSGTDQFARLQELAGRPAGGVWSLRVTGEEISLLAERDGSILLLIAGRQVATRERLEVLALGTRATLEDGCSLSATLAAARDQAALPVIPWGFGKWWFERGHLVRSQLESGGAGHLYLGDNGGRARILGEPRLLQRARSAGITVLPGSDPLPFPGQVRRVGSYGLAVDGALGASTPGEDLKRLLREQAARAPWFGRPQGLWRFAWAQSRMHAVRVLGSRS